MLGLHSFLCVEQQMFGLTWSHMDVIVEVSWLVVVLCGSDLMTCQVCV